MIELKQVSLARGGVSVLHDVSLNIPAGAITVVVGRSGVGKSTLIGSLNGLFRPSCGDITVNGIGPLRHDRAWQAHCRQTATIFQAHALIDRLSALDNVLLGLADQRHPLSPLPWPQALQLRAASALDEVGLTAAEGRRRVGTYSLGMRQRLGLAHALLGDPAALVLDEGRSLEPWLRSTFDAATTDAERLRVIVDQVASLTDVSVMAWHRRLVR